MLFFVYTIVFYQRCIILELQQTIPTVFSHIVLEQYILVTSRFSKSYFVNTNKQRYGKLINNLLKLVELN